MFAAPPVIKTEVFARVPENLRKSGIRSNWIDNQPGLNHTHSFLEGPSFDLDGNLYCVDIAHGRIFKVSNEGVFDVVTEYDGWPNGLKIDKHGQIFIADYKHGIMKLDPKTGRVEAVLERYRAERFKGVNDLVFASNGDMYFTDQGLSGLHDPTGRVFRYRESGVLDCILDNVPSPNGYVQMTGGSGPDGMALDNEGGLAVAHVGFGVVWHFSPRGEPLARIASCEGMLTTNMAYGGADNRDLFITESETGTILRAKLDVPGREMYSHM
jgi:gluconolactonase